MGLTDNFKTYSFLAHALGMISCFLCFLGAFLSIASCWTWIYMLFLGFVLAAIEAPFCLKCCENENTESCCKRFLRIIEYISGISRVFMYLFAIFPLLFDCPEATTVLISFCMLGSAFCYLMKWLGPRGGGAQRVSTDDLESGREELITDADREADSDDEANDQVDTSTANPWDRFVDSAAEQAGKAVAAAVTAQVKNEINAANPFAAQSQAKSLPSSPQNTAPSRSENPFATSSSTSEDDKEGNPFA